MNTTWGITRAVIYVLVPLSILLLAAAIVMSVLPWELKTGEFHWAFWAIGLAAGLGIFAAPGYVVALFKPSHSADGAAGQRSWLIASLSVAVLAALVAIPCTLVLAWPLAILPVATCGFCIDLLARTVRRWRRAS